jgi:hypothetical protein
MDYRAANGGGPTDDTLVLENFVAHQSFLSAFMYFFLSSDSTITKKAGTEQIRGVFLSAVTTNAFGNKICREIKH